MFTLQLEYDDGVGVGGGGLSATVPPSLRGPRAV
jgi:hypothetical protein